MSRTYIESLDGNMIFAIEDIQYIRFVETDYSKRVFYDYVKIVISNENLGLTTLEIHASEKDYDKQLKPYYNNLKNMLQTREVKSNTE